MRRPLVSVCLYLFLLAALSISSPRRTVGDAGEYTAYALAIADGHSPSLTRAAVADVQRDLASIDPSLASWDLEGAGHRSADGRVEFVHFWGYSALAAPFVAAARWLHTDPRDGFVVLNTLLLSLTFGIVSMRFSIGTACLIGASPILWWVDKAQVEVFVFAFAALALSIRHRPLIAAACIGAAAMQAPSLGVLLLFIVTDARGASVVKRVIAVVVGGAVAAVPVAYYLWRFHTPTLLAGAAQFHWPSRAELGVSLFDLNLGLVPNWPAAAVVAVLAILAGIAKVSGAAWRDFAAVAIALFVLTISFAQIGNFMSGGTPGILRYAVWLIPLAVPCLERIVIDAGWTRVVAALAIASLPMSLVRDRPSVPEFAGRPSALALEVWQRAPASSRPLPVVFAGSLAERTLPAVAPACTKMLLVGRGDAQGMWPRACAPFAVPAQCREPGVLCYANKTSDEYTFDRLTGESIDLKFDPSTVWPPGSAK